MPDHGTDKTEQAVIDTFKEMVLRERYDDIRVADLVRASDVGRSTFYDHFRDKDEVLTQSMAGIFAILASVLQPDCELSRVEGILHHFAEYQQATRQMLISPAAAVIRGGLADALLPHLPGGLPLPPPAVAQQLAEAALSLIRTWLTTHGDVPVPALAQALQRSLRGMITGYAS
jgi:AcrR family transcriptional regulator